MQAPIVGGGGVEAFPSPNIFFKVIFDGVQTAELGQGSD